MPPSFKNIRRYGLLIAAVDIFLVSGTLWAEQGDESAFFQQRAQHSYNSVFGLPAVAARPVQTFETQLSLEHSNQFAGGENTEESLVIDGESTEIVIRHRQRIGPCWQAEVHLPLVSHGGGEFDKAIDDWHRFFGLPDADRETVEFHQINYRYQNATGGGPDIVAPQSGVGDIQLAFQRSLRCFATADTTGAEPIARIGIKVPSGNALELRGSGATDLFADIQSPIWSRGPWRFGAAAGVLLTGSSRYFQSQRNSALYGAVGVHLRISQRLRLISQLGWHTPFYKSDLRELGSNVVNLGVGVRYLLPSNQSLELSIVEDVAVDTTPDIVARVAWIYRP